MRAHLYTRHANEVERGTRKGFVFKKIVKEIRIGGMGWVLGEFSASHSFYVPHL
jgi:hypothetical protein